MKIDQLSDQKLFQLCKQYGENALTWRRKFIGLLPEVYRRRLYEKKGFSSIFEFAAKWAGLSQEQVQIALNLEKRFFDKPILKNMLVNGEVSINKLVRIVTIATVENQEELAAKVKLLSKNALDVLVKDEKMKQSESGTIETRNGLSKTLFEDKSLPGQTGSLNFELSEEIIQQLNDLHAQGHDMNNLLNQMLQNRQEQIQQIKQEISEKTTPTMRRYIPIKIKKILTQEHGEKCSIQNRKKPSTQIHHTQRFALAHTHDPHYLAPLCNEHHQIAHSVDVKFHEVRLRQFKSA